MKEIRYHGSSEIKGGGAMRFLVGYDDSDASREALQVAFKYAGIFDAEIDVVSIMEQSPTLDYDRIRHAERSFENQINDLLEGSQTPRKMSMVITAESTGKALVQYADHHQCEQIFIGVHRISKVGKFVFGSTAQYVILNAHCPVVSVK